MATKMTVKTFVNNLTQARAALEDLMATLDNDTLTKPGVVGNWSIKDTLAHITWFDREILGMLEAKFFKNSGLWQLPTDERNAAIYEKIKDQSLDKVQAEAMRAYSGLLLSLEEITDQDLHNPANFHGMPEDWVPWEIMASNTYQHYQDHLQEIKDWLKT